MLRLWFAALLALPLLGAGALIEFTGSASAQQAPAPSPPPQTPRPQPTHECEREPVIS